MFEFPLPQTNLLCRNTNCSFFSEISVNTVNYCQHIEGLRRKENKNTRILSKKINFIITIQEVFLFALVNIT